MISDYGLNRLLKKVAARAGVKKRITAHLFRHTLATHLVMDKRSIATIRDKMRHSNISVTSLYSWAYPAEMKEMTDSLGTNLLSNNTIMPSGDYQKLIIQ